MNAGTFSSFAGLRAYTSTISKGERMQVNKLIGWFFILLGVIQILHEIFLRWRDNNVPGVPYTIVTALFFTLGFVFLWKKPIRQRPALSKAKGPSIFQD
jgi:hypothetical protein